MDTPNTANTETPVPTSKDFYLALADASKAEKNRIEHMVDTYMHNHHVFEMIDQRLKIEIDLIKQLKYPNGWYGFHLTLTEMVNVVPESKEGREIITQLKNRCPGFNISFSTNAIDYPPSYQPRPTVVVFRLP